MGSLGPGINHMTERSKSAIKVRVKRAHILKGTPCSASLCPIALALQEQFGAYCNAVVRYCHVGGKSYLMSKRATQFICAFDGAKSDRWRRSLKPFTFTAKRA